MKKHVTRWLALALALQLILCPLALAEDEPASAAVEEVPEAWIGIDLSEVIFGDMEEEAQGPLPEQTLPPVTEPPVLETIEIKPYAYAWVTGGTCTVCSDAALTDPLYELEPGEAVLVTGDEAGLAIIAFNSEQGALEGFVPADAVSLMTPAEADNLLDELAESDAVALYEDDVNWPLPLAVKGMPLAASDFTALSNDAEYVVQGKTITARMVGDHSDCWSWARALYQIIWGTKFTTDYIGTDETGLNLIRNITDDNERLLTGENLKNFIGQSELGCTLRICSCPSDCSNFSKDGCSKHEKHSLMVVAKDEDGMVVMDNMTGNGKDRFATRYYTWDNFAKHWAKYKMIKYIKWPHAPTYVKGGTATPTPAPIQATALALDVRTLSLVTDQTHKLTATVEPEGADGTLKWSSSDPFVAYADGDGNVTAVGPGKTVITAATSNGLTAAVNVVVTDTVITPTKVTLSSKGTVTLGINGTLQLAAALSPEGAQSALAWKSSNEKVATVSNTGLVTGLKTGTATIAVATANKKTAKVKVKVVDLSNVTKVKLNKSGTVTLAPGATLALTAKLTPAAAVTTLTWKSTDESVATISDNGVVTAVKAGTCTVGAIAANGKYAKVKIKVVSTDAVTKVKLNKSGTVKLKVGKTLQLKYAVRPTGAEPEVVWKSTNEKVAKISQSGLVTAVKTGTCTVGVITENGKYATVKIKVVK